VTDDTPDGTTDEIALSVSTLGNQSTMDKAEETTQLDERRIATDVGRGIVPPYDPSVLASFQELNETHQACIRKKSRYEAGYGFDIVPHPSADEPETGEGTDHETVRNFWYGSDSRWQIGPEGTAMSTPEEVLELGRQDYHGIGWTSLEVLVEGDGTPVGLAHVPAATVRVRKTVVGESEDGEEIIESGHGYVQIRQGRRRYFGEAGDRYGDEKRFVDKKTGEVADDASKLDNEPANELIFLPNPSPLSLYYGVPDWVAAMQTMGADQAAKEWNHDVFDNLGIPYYAIQVTGGKLTEDSKEELRGLMDNLKGSRYRTAILEVGEFEFENDNPLNEGDPRDVEIELVPIGSREDLDMEFQAFRERNEHEIAKVHEVPPILINVTSTSNRANSKEQVREFATDVIAPEQSKFEARLYSIIHQTALEVDDWTIDFELHGADQPQEEARMAEQRVRAMRLAGVATVNQALEELDLPTRDDEYGDMMLQEFEAEFATDGSEGDAEAMLTRSKAAPPTANKIGERASIDIDVEKDPIEQTTFSSSNLDEGLYDFGERELYLSFQRPDGQNSLYVYVDVPATVWSSLVNAASAGSYHYSEIRMEYGYLEITNNHERLPEGPTPDPGDVPDDVPDDL